MVVSRRDARWVIVAPFDDLAIGASFPRSEWPAHVTLASNFAADASADDLVASLARADPPAAMRVEFAGRALFGRAANIPVQLVEADRLSSVHHRLADELERLPGFAPDDPDFWRDGYRPHVTLRPSIQPIEGTGWTTSGVAIARLLGATATIVGRTG